MRVSGDVAEIWFRGVLSGVVTMCMEAVKKLGLCQTFGVLTS